MLRIVNVLLNDANHGTKMAARFSSAPKFSNCVGYGYIVGFDEKTRDRAYSDIEAFLTKHLGTGG